MPAKCNSSFVSALHTSQLVHNSMNSQLMIISVVFFFIFNPVIYILRLII